MNTGAAYNAKVHGYLPNGLSVVVDANIATNLGTGTTEDGFTSCPRPNATCGRTPRRRCSSALSSPPSTLGVLLVLYGYFAYSFRRYTNGMVR